MSLKLVVRIMYEVDLPRGKQLVLMGMAENANDDGTGSRPSVDKIAWKSNYKPRRVVTIMRELEREGVIVKVREAAQHRAAEYDIRIGVAPQKMPFEEWRALYGRHASDPSRGAKNAPLDGEGAPPRGATASAPLDDAPGVQNGDPGVQPIAPLEEDPGVQFQNSGVQSPSSEVQKRCTRGATASAPEPVNQSNDSSNEPVGGNRRGEPPRPAGPTGGELVASFFDRLSEVRTRRRTPKDGQRPVSGTGPWSRGRIAADVKRELDTGRDAELVERSLGRMALRWDERRLELADAMGDVLDGKPWTVEQEERARAALNGGPGGARGASRGSRSSGRRDSIAVVGATEDDYREEDYRFHA